MPWIILILAGLLEAVWAVGLKFTEGFTKPLPSLLVALAMAASMFLLAHALKTLPIATAYAIWVSIGILGAALAQPLLFKEPLRAGEIFFLALLLISVIGLKLTATK